MNHSVNDILVHGAAPLAFMDYIAGAGASGATNRGKSWRALLAAAGRTGWRSPAVKRRRCRVVPLGYVRCRRDHRRGGRGRPRAPRGEIAPGRSAPWLYASTGLHTNGYTLARRIILDADGIWVTDQLEGAGRTVADALLAIHRSYYLAVAPVLDRLHGLAHITGGGLPG